MQKKELIPTPLVVGARAPITIVENQRPPRLRFFRVVGFILSLVWFWWKTVLSLLLTGKAHTKEGARRARRFLERMGGMWVKGGQIMAMRRDLFMTDTCDELSKLQDRAQGFPFHLVKEVLEEELGSPLSVIFSEFNELPMAAASIGQTHEARLRHNGARVAVKVQRPFIAENFAKDVRYLHFVAFWLRNLGIEPQGRWDEMLWELEKALVEETDYRMEASSIARMRKTLKRHKIYVPKVFFAYCSRRVLVMEFVDGVFMSDYIQMAGSDPDRLTEWLRENDIDPAKVGERLMLSHMRQLFEDNLYHGDLHPGNIVLQRKSRIAFIDFGTIGSLDRSLLQRYRLMFAAIAEGDYAKAAEMFLLTCPSMPDVDMSALKSELVRALRVWESRTTIKQMPYYEKSLTKLFAMITVLARKYQVPPNWEFLRLSRSDLTMDASLLFLFPRINYLKIFRTYERQLRERTAVAAMRRKARQRTMAGLLAAAQLPGQLAENLYFEGEWLRKRAVSFEGKISKFAQVAKGVLTLGALGAMAVGAGLLIWFVQYYGREQALGSSRLDRMFRLLESYRPEVWVILALVAIYLSRRLMGIRNILVRKSYERPTTR